MHGECMRYLANGDSKGEARSSSKHTNNKHLEWTVGNGDARGVYPTQDTSRMETARVEEEKGADTRIIIKE